MERLPWYACLALLASALAACSAGKSSPDGGKAPDGGLTSDGGTTPDGGTTGMTTDVIPASRRTVWQPGIPGGIPVRTTVCATVTPAYASSHGLRAFGVDGSGDAQPAIQQAMD